MLVILIEARPLRDGIHGLYSGGCMWNFVLLLPGEEISTRGQRPHLDDPGWCAKDQKGRVLQAGSPITSTYLRLMVARSPHAKSCVQKVNLPPPFLVGHSLKTPWSPYSTQRSPGMQWWSHALKSSTDGGLGFWVYSIISMASWSPVNWGNSHRIGFHSNEAIAWCVLNSIPQSNFSKG